MGIVYAALDYRAAQRVAIKVLGVNDPEASARFLNEARAAAKIQHDNIARVTDMGTLPNGMPFMVLELLVGCDLEQVLQREGRIPVAAAVDYVLQALEAVAKAHAVGIVHRDLKPANLFLARRPDGSFSIKVLDFGVSKSSDLLFSGTQTHAHALLGSPYYMSPEQLRSARTVDRRADLWSMGVILFELISGTYPFYGESIGDLFTSIVQASPKPLHDLRPDCPPALAAVVARCLVRDLAQRWDSAQALAEALAPFATGLGLASVQRLRSPSQPPAPSPSPIPPSRVDTVRPPPRPTHPAPSRAPRSGRWAAVWVMSAAILLGIGLGAGAFSLYNRTSGRPAAPSGHGASVGTTYE
jgi:serine/threonine-protein kinase